MEHSPLAPVFQYNCLPLFPEGKQDLGLELPLCRLFEKPMGIHHKLLRRSGVELGIAPRGLI
jgi:hypothetical protein